METMQTNALFVKTNESCQISQPQCLGQVRIEQISPRYGFFSIEAHGHMWIRGDVLVGAFWILLHHTAVSVGKPD